MPRLDLDDATIAYETAGHAGPPLLLVQGVGALGEGWRLQVDALAGDHRLAWLDNRGIGGSLPSRGPVTIPAMAGDCLALMDHLGWPEAHLVGHSMGGMIVQEIARRAPTRVRSLALLSTARRGRAVLGMRPSTLLASLRMRFGSQRSRWLAFAGLGFPRAHVAAVGGDRLVELLRPAFCADFVDTPAIVRAQLAALWRHTGGSMAPLQAIPTLIATGADDRTVATRLSDDLLAHLPRARLVRFDDAGHALTLQHPEAIAALLREHVAAAG